MSALLNLGDKITAGNRADATFFYKKRVADDSGTLLTEAETDANNRELLAQKLFDKASIVYTAGGVKASKAYSVKGTDFTVTRAGVKNVIGRDGVLTEIPANTPATEFANGVLKGTLIEPARTNRIRNNTMQGAVVGSPGTLPTNWTNVGSSALTQEVVGSGVVNGIEYSDIRLHGVASGSEFIIAFEGNTQIAASAGQVWTNSIYLNLSIASGLTPTIENRINWRTGAGVFVSFSALAVAVFGMARNGNTATAPATTEFARPEIKVGLTSGQSYDFTIRIGLPQMEQSAVATSVIRTTDTAITQPADVITATGLGSVLPQTEGTLYAEVEMKSVGSVARSIFDINNGTTGTRASIVATAQLPDTFRIGLNSGGLVQCLFDSPFVGGTIYKIALACKVNDFTSYINGTSIGTDNSGIVPEFTQIGIGNLAGGISQTNGWIRMVALFPTRLTNAELETLTTL
jgi:hypothetical protein